ncbi:type II toxin-antitoxin system toxin DhiT [Dickeya ananatis]|uniref:type II toxin-antitoxin system toxin DhiT n=1 Tax=Dickeya ananatis TaxID=3061286 RepID=UPI00388EDB06
MPEIDRLAGLIFHLYFYDDERHHLPHVHVCYGNHELIISIRTGTEIEGYLPTMAHREQLLSMWAQAVIGKNPGKL